MLADNVRAGAPGPDLQLIGSGGPEGISGAHQHPFPLVPQLLGQLSDGGGLPHPVYADDQHHRGLGIQTQAGVAHVQHLHQDVLQGRFGLLRLPDFFLLHPAAQALHRPSGSLHSQVGQDQAFLQLVVKIVVQIGKAGKYIAQSLGHGFSGFGQAFFDFTKKTHNLSPLIL